MSENNDTMLDNIVFDDFSYTGSDDPELEKSGWAIRTGTGEPGPSGCVWSKENVSFVEDPDMDGNFLLRLSAATDGTGEGSAQSEIFHKTKYFEGTYAARVRFTGMPLAVNARDLVNETFFLISPLAFDNDPDYSECDFEYLINGGWGVSETAMWNTTWKTYCPSPWSKDNIYNCDAKSYDGWHVLVCTVSGGKVRYFIDGVLMADHGDRFYPRKLMSMNFNIWFLHGGLAPDRSNRTYVQDIDWVFHVKDKVLSSEKVLDSVSELRKKRITRIDIIET